MPSLRSLQASHPSQRFTTVQLLRQPGGKTLCDRCNLTTTFPNDAFHILVGVALSNLFDVQGDIELGHDGIIQGDQNRCGPCIKLDKLSRKLLVGNSSGGKATNGLAKIQRTRRNERFTCVSPGISIDNRQGVAVEFRIRATAMLPFNTAVK